MALCPFVYISTKRKRILICKLISDILSCICMLFTGFRVAGAYANSVAIARESVFYQRTRHKWADHVAWVFLFLLLMSASPVIDYFLRGELTWLAFLPASGSILVVIAFFNRDPLRIKIMVFFGTAPYLFYNMLVFENGSVIWSFNIPVIIATVLPMLSALIGIAREIRIRHKKEPPPEETETSLQTTAR